MLNEPEWVILSSAPVAFRWTRMSLDRASRVRGTRAPDLAIFVLLSSKKECQLLERDGRAKSKAHHVLQDWLRIRLHCIAPPHWD